MRRDTWFPLICTVAAGVFCVAAWTPLFCARAQVAPVTGTTPVVPYVFVDMPVRDSLATWWNTDAFANERMYCVTRFSITDTPVHAGKRTVIHRLIEIWEITAASFQVGTPYTTTGICGNHEPTLHTHPANTCLGNKCMVGGFEADQCGPSQQDLASLAYWADTKPFALIQCGPRQVIAYVIP